ncbi:hypothetical protein TrVE_jg11289 [Triparma verrucosa]|uniref:EF-hand domain-containing protein n=1 Tax=Triparma verrucosa TaxID=1606542 RepID=A0A9W7KVY8_9STRA|nr:hypothetical protein TrVE_jg11289 [Triparma verrucosa]
MEPAPEMPSSKSPAPQRPGMERKSSSKRLTVTVDDEDNRGSSSIQKLDANETDKELTKSKRQIFMYSLLCIFLYMGLGLVFLYFVEKWSFVNALYFVVVTLTTVGFGDQSAWDDNGWEDDGIVWFISLYALFGIMLVGAALGIVAAEVLEEAQATKDKKAADMKTAQLSPAENKKGFSQSVGSAAGVAGDLAQQYINPTILECARDLGPSIFVLCFVLGVGMVLIYFDHKDSPDMPTPTFAQCFYFAVITGTTIGYGDYSFATQWGRGVGCVYVLFSVIALGSVLGDIANHFIEKKQQAALEKILKKKITVEDFKKFDIDGDGRIEKTEFVLKKLMLMDMIKAEDIERCEEEFEAMDADDSGEITMEDLEMYIENRDKIGSPPASATRRPTKYPESWNERPGGGDSHLAQASKQYESHLVEVDEKYDRL